MSTLSAHEWTVHNLAMDIMAGLRDGYLDEALSIVVSNLEGRPIHWVDSRSKAWYDIIEKQIKGVNDV
jgi:hypothetical protein